MQKFFTTPTSNGHQLPVAVMIRPIPHSKSTHALNCTGALIGMNDSDINSILTALPNYIDKKSISHGTLVTENTLEFKLDQDYFQIWQSTHSTIKKTSPQMACDSTQVFFLFATPQNCTELNLTREFIEDKFTEAKLFFIDYSESDLKLNPISAPFESAKLVNYTTQTQELFYDAFFTILKQLDKLAPTHALPNEQLNQKPSSSSCSIL